MARRGRTVAGDAGEGGTGQVRAGVTLPAADDLVRAARYRAAEEDGGIEPADAVVVEGVAQLPGADQRWQQGIVNLPGSRNIYYPGSITGVRQS